MCGGEQAQPSVCRLVSAIVNKKNKKNHKSAVTKKIQLSKFLNTNDALRIITKSY